MMSFCTPGRRATVLPAALALLVLAGCSSDDRVPECLNCEAWTQVTDDLARFPQPNPSDAGYILYSTIAKTTNAPDASRDADEDIWLLHWDDGVGVVTGKWQLTGNELGEGDNLGARWSPSGTQVAFMHTTGSGTFDVWRMSIALPGAPGEQPVIGAAELVVRDARDPAWETETSLAFVREDKIYRLDVPVGSGLPTGSPVQLTFNPPQYASTEKFIDRHPMFASDGFGVFNTTGRRGVADILIRAFEIDGTVFPPDTTETDAWIGFRSPVAAGLAYPLFDLSDTLRTPRASPLGADGRLRSVPARRAARLAVPSRERRGLLRHADSARGGARARRSRHARLLLPRRAR